MSSTNGVRSFAAVGVKLSQAVSTALESKIFSTADSAEAYVACVDMFIQRQVTFISDGDMHGYLFSSPDSGVYGDFAQVNHWVDVHPLSSNPHIDEATAKSVQELHDALCEELLIEKEKVTPSWFCGAYCRE